MLQIFYTIRTALSESQFIRQSRQIKGVLTVTNDLLPLLTKLQDNGYIERSTRDGKSFSHLPDAVGQQLEFILKPCSLNYYEDIQDLISYTAEEPANYYVNGIGEVVSEANGGIPGSPPIESYRQMLRAKKLLRTTSDFETTGKAIFLTPEKLEIPLVFSLSEIPSLTHLRELQDHFEKRSDRDPADREQRLVLFRKNLREYLKAYPPEDRFCMFLRNFEIIFDNYNRDYQLWIGNTFGELEKSFEEKRLKFVADLNGILAGVQASLLAVPIAAILLGDKYDLGNPLKDFLLACGILTVALIAFQLLGNQKATLEATRAAINATKEDFEKKHTRRREEFKTRLQNLDEQEKKVRSLLNFIRFTIIVIVIAGFLGWIIAWA